jgi:hypothetical protein
MLGTIAWNHGALSPAFYNPITFPTPGGSLTRAFGSGSAMVEQHVNTPEAFVGVRQLGFYGDFYERFHITTLDLNLGNLVSDQTQEITLWNAYRRAWILNDLVFDNAEGLTISGQPNPPLQFAPLQERTYTLGVSIDGPAIIAASISWEFSNGESVVLAVSGARIVAWSWPPDWTQGMLERLQWRTDVITAYRGQEQRRSVRLDPRQGLEFTVTAEGQDRRFMESILWNWGARTFAVPLWMDGQELAATLTSGASSIPVNPANRSYSVGDLVMLIGEDPRTYEVIEVSTLTGSIGLVRPTQQTWPPGTRVYPCRAARIINEQAIPRFTGQVASIRLQFEMSDTMPGSPAASPTYRSYPVFEQKPDWSMEPNITLARKLAVMDSDTGLVMVEDEAQIPLTSQRMKFTLVNRSELAAWRSRLYALRGKQGGIWVPTWADDLTVAALIGDTATNIDIQWTGYPRYYQMDPNRRDIRIELVSGQVLYRRITGATELSQTVERLSIDASLGLTVQPSQVALVSFMALSRNESDTAELSYFTGDVAEVTFTAKGYRSDV